MFWPNVRTSGHKSKDISLNLVKGAVSFDQYQPLTESVSLNSSVGANHESDQVAKCLVHVLQ